MATPVPLAPPAPAFAAGAAPKSSVQERPNSFYAPAPVSRQDMPQFPPPVQAQAQASTSARPEVDSSAASTASTPPSSLGSEGSPPALIPAQTRGRTPNMSVVIPGQSTGFMSPSRSRDQSTASSLASRPSTPTLPVSPSLMLHHGRLMLQPGSQAERLSHEKTLDLYRKNAKKLQDPDLMYELAVIMVESSSSSKEGPERNELIKDAIVLLRNISDRGHADAQYFLADCYAKGLVAGKPQYDKAYPLFVLASKHGHAHAAFRTGNCLEEGLGCMQSNAKAVRMYRKAAADGHPGAMFRMATAELNGELGLLKSAKGGVKWMKLSAELATTEYPQAVHEMAMLHQRGIDNVVFHDDDFACELLARAAELGYAPSAYKLGMNYEYAKMGCPPDPGLSIHMYNIAAQQNHPEACFALCAWYLVGAPGILPQSDTEAYLWAKKAAEQGLAKAEYAVGYFSEMGIGAQKDLAHAKAWYNLALQHGDRRASTRIQNLGRVSAAQLTPSTPSVTMPQTQTSVATEGGKHYTVHTVSSYRNSSPQPRSALGSRSRSNSSGEASKKGWFRA